MVIDYGQIYIERKLISSEYIEYFLVSVCSEKPDPAIDTILNVVSLERYKNSIHSNLTTVSISWNPVLEYRPRP